MPRRKVNLPSANAVGAGQTATFDLPTDRRYHVLVANYKTNANQATIESDITEIRIKINGKVQRRYSAAELFKLNALNGIAFQAGMLPIFFSEPWRRNMIDEDSLSWGMRDVSTFQIEIDIDAGAVAPTLGGFAIIDNVSEILTSIIKVRKQVVPVTTAGLTTVSTLPKHDIYHRIHCFETAANDIIDIEVTLDSLEVFKLKDAENDFVLGMRKLVPQVGVFHILFDETQRVTDAIPMVKSNGRPISEFRIDVNMAVANSFTMLTETRGEPD